MLKEEDANRGATALIVDVVNSVMRKTRLSARTLLGTKLAKDVSTYRPRKGKPRQSVSAQKLKQIINALMPHLEVGDEDILLRSWEIEQSESFTLPLARGTLLFGLKKSDAVKHVAKLVNSKDRTALGTALGVRSVLQRKSLGLFRKGPQETLPRGSDRLPVPGELLARALLALADAHLEYFQSDKELQPLEHAQIRSDTAMVVGWFARQTEDTEILATARRQATEAARINENQQMEMNSIILDWYAADLSGQQVNFYERFEEAKTFPNVGLAPLSHVERSIARRCAKAFALSCANPFWDKVHEGMTPFRWLLSLRDQADKVEAHDQVVVIDAAIIEAAAKRFHQAQSRHLQARCCNVAMKAWADMTFRMHTSPKYKTSATRETRIECQKVLQPLFDRQRQFK